MRNTPMRGLHTPRGMELIAPDPSLLAVLLVGNSDRTSGAARSSLPANGLR